MRKASSRGPTRRQRAELDALSTLPDAKFDTRGMPEMRDWSSARRGVFYRPVKQQIACPLT
jgi:hypothetical protein